MSSIQSLEIAHDSITHAHVRKKIAVVILNYNNWQDTLVCVESVLTGIVRPTWLLIVDNGSCNDSIRRIRHWAAGKLEFLLPELGAVTSIAKPLQLVEINDTSYERYSSSKLFLIRKAVNKGYASGNNAGLLYAMKLGADAVWILNNDTVIDKNALGAMQKKLFSKDRPGLCGSLVLYMDTNLVQCRAGGFYNKWTGLSILDGNKQNIIEAQTVHPDEVERRINFIYGASVMVSRTFIENVGLMDDRYFLYNEEQDWAFSAKGQFDFAYANEAIIYHREGRTTGFSCNQFNIKCIIYIIRSRILLTCKHVPYTLPVVCLFIIYAIFRKIYKMMII
jgi:GT2 family glycosyltransferase